MQARRPSRPDSFQQFQASVLFCATCRAPQPVRERLLLVFPDGGELHEYLCASCGASLGSRRASGAPPVILAS